MFMTLLLSVTGCMHRKNLEKERASLHWQIGNGHMAEGNIPAALSEFLQAEQLDPQNCDVQNSLGLAYSARQRYRDAEKHFRLALELQPKFSDARANLAKMQIDAKRFSQAHENLKMVEDDLTYPLPEKIFTLRGIAYFEEGNYPRAEQYLARAMKVRRDSCVTTAYYGRTLFEEKKLEDAASMLDLAVENCRAARFDEPLFYSAMAHYSLGDKEKTKARLEELISGYPNSQFLKKAKGLKSIME